MAEIIFQRRKVATVVNDPNPLIILLLISILQLCGSQVINRAPHFIPQIGDMSQFSISEDTTVGTPVYQLKGVDPEHGQLKYSISGQFFTVDSQTGVVTLAKALDRETQNALEVIISITDEPLANTEPNTISLRRVIPVKDVNDNPPVFHNRPYNVNISEATAVGSEIEVSPEIIVTDKDEGENAQIRVVCSTKEKGSDFEACTTFRVVTEKLSSNEFQVRLYLDQPLDYESRSAYVISLEASDASGRPLKAVASVAASIWDVQDQPPVFINAPYSTTVAENTPPFTSIMEIVAKDGDTANPRPVLLTLEGDSEQYFKLYPERPIGKAVLMASEIPLDRESNTVMQNGGVYNFFVKATELINNEVPSDYTVTPITIIVSDVDDHVPEFNSQVFNISIPENIENGSPIPGLSIYVEDHDLGQNSKYGLILRDVFNSEGVFSISPEQGEGRTPISIKVMDSSKLDYDVDDESKRIFSFDIVTHKNGMELSTARVNIKLLDMNDNAPVFDSLTYKFNVLENSTIGAKIGDIRATDKDYGIFGEIEYQLTGFGTDFFRTDQREGGIHVNQNLDYEKQKSYSLNIFARDGGGKESTASIFIDVIDVNDNAPKFDYPDYSRTIRDGATDFEPQFVIRATDSDGPTQGDGRVRYSLITDNSIKHKGQVFLIDEESGEITIKDTVDSMDTPRGQYELVIRATDFGIPPLHNDTRVYIRVGVPGNQRPTFKGNYHNYNYVSKPRNPDSHEDYTFDLNPMNYKVSIREDAKPGENVTTVVATDPDGLDDLLTYHIVSGSKDNFIINNKSGLITVSSDANLDRDINSDRYEILVSAVDSGTPIPETATTTVFVTIEDVNDKPPKFNMTDLTTYISEKTKIGNVVTQMAAYDSDVNSKLKFSLVEPTKAFSKAGIQLKSNSPYDYKRLFRIDENTGEIFVNGSLDYSQVSRVILTIKVEDINAELNKESQYAVMDYTIYIQPYADKNPQFTNSGWTASNPTIYQKIKEEQPLGSTILVLNAEDPVSGYTVSNFKVINSETGLLQVDPLSGQVVLTRHLDYEELITPNLTLTVMATSNDGSKSSIAKIIVEVVNSNDNAPIFEKELYKVSVLESVVAPEQVLIVKANDADAVLTDEDKITGYSDIRYTLKGENSDLFTINNVTGVIQVAANKTLDRERQSVLRLEIEATDMPHGGADQKKSTAVILIDVLDVDDNTPTFEKRAYTAVVAENVPVGISVINITATDPDEGLGGEIKYDFLDEGETNGYFTINATSGEVKTRKPLTGKGRTDPYHLIVGAEDGGAHSADAALTLYIGDVSANDGVPRFIRPAPEEVLKISENATIGSPVFEVVASDPDDPTQPSGQLYYTIQPSNEDAKSFAIDPKSGLITTRHSLDREKKDFYTLVLMVTDRGEPPQQSTRIAKVKVTDVDDHKPHFKRSLDDSPVLISVKEEIPIGSVVGEFKAIDEDIGENAEIDYMITAGNDLGLVKLQRTNDSKALILAAGRLDRESIAKFVLTVKCFKLGTKPKISKYYNRLDPSEIQYLIKIEDIDDHLPEFGNANITFGVRLNVAPDTVIGTLKAVDKDPDAPPIQYNIVNISFESPIKERSTNNVTEIVVLNGTTGELKIKKNLIHYADGIFRLLVRANNSKDVERFTEVLVEVVVVRERDLLRLVLDSGRKSRIAELRNTIEGAISPVGLKMQLHDAQHTEFYSNPGPCFQFRKSSTGEALPPAAMKHTIRSLGAQFQAILQAHHVVSVAACGRARAQHSPAQRALLAVAAVLPLAAVVAAIVLCCLHSNAKRRSRSAMLIARDATIVTPSCVSGPTRLYAEPLYST